MSKFQVGDKVLVNSFGWKEAGICEVVEVEVQEVVKVKVKVNGIMYDKVIAADKVTLVKRDNGGNVNG